jgi:hypothetical protein
MIVDGVMQIRVADSGAVATSGGAAEFAVAIAVRDAAELLDIDVDQVARRVVLVAVRRRPADRQTGGLVEVSQLRHPVTAQDRLDGRAGDMQVVGDAVWSPAAGESHLDDPSFGVGRGLVWAVTWSTRVILHCGLATVAVAVDPLLDRRRRALEPLRYPA